MDISRAKALLDRRPKRKRVGRGVGSGHGKTAGRGHNGARSRSGWSSRGLTGGGVQAWRRMPKGGFSNAPFKTAYSVVNVSQLERFPDGALVTVDELRRHGLVRQVAVGGVKVLGDGELSKRLTIRVNAFSNSARAKIESAGGTAELVPARKAPVRNKMGARSARPAAGNR
jgi:large subunit ribosomal protein L15